MGEKVEELTLTIKPTESRPIRSDLWQEAYLTLTEDERRLLDAANDKNIKQRDLLADALEMIDRRKTECIKKQWKVKIGDKVIILRDVFEKMSVWTDSFIDIADNLMACQSPQVSLPWAAIRFFLKAGVNDVQTFAVVADCTTSTANIITYCSIMEELLRSRKSLHLDNFENTLTSLYIEILRYFSKVICYYSQNTAKRVLKSLIVDKEELQSWSDPYKTKLEELRRLSEAMQHEELGIVIDGVTQINTQLAEQARAFKQKLDKMQEPITRIDTKLAKIEDELDGKHRLKILNSISKIPYRMHHKTASTGRLVGSGKWLITKEVFVNWRDDSTSSVLWLHGIPGCGKTKIASMVIDELQKTSHLAYFYCIRSPAEPERGQCNRILASYVRQLASTTIRGPILDPVRERHEELLMEGFEGFDDHAWSSEESIDILIKLTELYPCITFVLDGLDEAADRGDLLDAFKQVIAGSNCLVKIFISSRDSIEIVRKLQDSPNLYVKAYDNAQDITRFISERLEKRPLLEGELPTDTLQLIKTRLVEGANGMFRWAELQLESLRAEKSLTDILNKLGRLPATLDDSYWNIYQQIQKLGESARNLANLTIQWLLYSKSNMLLCAFARLASIRHQAHWSPHRVMNICANVVVTDETGLFRFAHLSVREFFEALPREGRPITDFQPAQAHAALASINMKFLTCYLEDKLADKTGSLIDNVNTWHIVTLTRDDNLEDNKQNVAALDELAKVYAIGHLTEHLDECRPLAQHKALCSEIKGFSFQNGTPTPIFLTLCTMVESYKHVNFPEPDYAELKNAITTKNPLSFAYWLDLPEANNSYYKDRDTKDWLLSEEEVIAKGAITHAAMYGKEAALIDLMDQLAKWQGLEMGLLPFSDLALSSAILRNQIGVVTALLQRGYAPSIKDLLLSVSSRHDKIFASIMNAGFFRDKDLGEALTKAIWSKYEFGIRTLLEAGALKLTDDLYRAIRMGSSNEAMAMIDNVFDIDGHYGVEQRTLLHWSVEKKLYEVSMKLFERGASVDEVDDNNETPLHLAARRGTPEIVKMLLDHGADTTKQNIWNETPLTVARTRLTFKSEIKSLLEQAEEEPRITTNIQHAHRDPSCIAE